MDIQLATNTTGTPRIGGPVAAGGIPSAGRGRGGLRGRGGFRGGRGGRGGMKNNTKTAKTQEELDAELDTYAKMQTD